MQQQQQEAATPKDQDDDLRLGLQQLHVQALLLLGKAHGLAPNESDAAAHCFLLAACGPCPPLRPLALENLRVSFARLAAMSGGGGAHRLASLHWDTARHTGLVAAALSAFRQQQTTTSGEVEVTRGARRRHVILVAGPTAALLALLVARELREGEAGVLVVEDSRVAATLGRTALEANGFGVGKADSPILGFVESRVLLQRLAANKQASGASVEEGKGMEDEEGKEGRRAGREQKEQVDVVYAGLLFDPFPYTLLTLPLRILVRVFLGSMFPAGSNL